MINHSIPIVKAVNIFFFFLFLKLKKLIYLLSDK